MGKMLVDDAIYVAVYKDESGQEHFATWGSWGSNQIRWYKTRKQGERMLAEVMADEYRGRNIPKNTRIVRFQMEVDTEDI